MENEILDRHLLTENAEIRHEYAGFWIRVGASLVDFLVYLPVLGVNLYNLYYWKSLPLELFSVFVLMAYKPFMEYQYGATLGKMAVKIRVVDSDSQMISFTQSVIRNIPSLLSQVISVIGAVLLFMHADFQSSTSMAEVATLQEETMSPIPEYFVSLFAGICYISVGVNVNKQGIHDQMAKTFCVKV